MRKNKKASELQPYLNHFFQLSENDILRILQSIEQADLTPYSHLWGNPDCQGKNCAEAAFLNEGKFIQRSRLCPPLPVIDVVLSIHRTYRLMVEPVMKDLMQESDNAHESLTFLRTKTFVALQADLKNFLPDYYAFFEKNRNRGEHHYTFSLKEKSIIRNTFHFREVNSTKMQILFNLLCSIPEFRKRFPFDDDFELMHWWATDYCEQSQFYLDNGEPALIKLAQALGNKIPNVADTTIQHLRLYFGGEVYKPDQRLKEVLLNKFCGIPTHSDLFDASKLDNEGTSRIMRQIGKSTGKKYSYLDSVFVNYGSGYYPRKIPKNKAILKEIVPMVQRLSGLKVSIADIAYATGYAYVDIQRMLGGGDETK